MSVGLIPSRFALRLLTSLAAAAALMPMSMSVQAQQNVAANACGSLANAFGPFDYRPDHYKPVPGDQYSHAYKLNLVEIAHFTPKVEALLAGQSTNLAGPDLDYTLRAFPNHHRALAALLRLSERTKLTQPLGLPRSIGCYFDRAARYVPDDVIVRMLYASFLFKAGQAPRAREEIEQAQRLAGDNPYTNFNIGLVCVEAGEYDMALKQAHRALALGFPRLDLKEKLVAAGRWSEPPPEAARAAPAAASSNGATAAPAASAP